MKIGVMTYWTSSNNYGQMLQAWALQKWLKENGHDPYIIRYDPTRNERALKKAIYRRRILNIIRIYPIVIKLFNYKKEKHRKELYHKSSSKDYLRSFKEFKENHLVFSEECYYSLKELRDNPPIADMYIAGSDQVWHGLLNDDENKSMFLDFGRPDIKRISYAASFGRIKYPKKLNLKLRKNLERFNAISVRERAGVDICRNIGLDAIHVCDPTLLMSKSGYSELLETTQTPIGSDYVFIYSLNIKDAKEYRWGELKRFLRKSNLKVKVTNANGYLLGAELFGNEVEYDYATIPQWLKNIEKASFVVTSSFHGIVFSIILHTPFVYVPLKGILARSNSRITDLLDKLQLNNRILSDTTTYEWVTSNDIEWDKVDKLLEKFCKSSITYLKMYCGEN